MIGALIFDFAGVLTTTDAYWDWLAENVPDLETKRHIFRGLSDDVDRAAITHAEFVAGFAKAAGIPSETVWPKIKRGFALNRELVDLIRNLRATHKTGILSNFTSPWLTELLAEYDLRKEFDTVLISSEEKMIKPDPRFFEKMLTLLDVQPNETMFFDDKQENVDGALRLGIRAFLFTTNDRFRSDLEKL